MCWTSYEPTVHWTLFFITRCFQKICQCPRPLEHRGFTLPYVLYARAILSIIMKVMMLKGGCMDWCLNDNVTLLFSRRDMNNAWSEMVSSTPCLALYCSFLPWFIQTIWDNSSPTMDQPCWLITTLFLLVLHSYAYEQSNAPPSTLDWILFCKES